jgi:hypothetical protein
MVETKQQEQEVDKDALWKELKLKWSALKRTSNSNDQQKAAAKVRINEIQDSLKIDKTDFDAPYEGKTNNAKGKTNNAKEYTGPDRQTSSADYQKLMGTILDKSRVLEEKLDLILTKINKPTGS